MFMIFWDILITERIFFLPQVKRSVIIFNKHATYELPHELPNDLRQKLKFSRSVLFHMKTRVFLKYFVHSCSYQTLWVAKRVYKNSFFGMTLWIWKMCNEKGKKQQNIEYLKTEKSFVEEIKSIFHNFWNAFFW